MHNTAELLGRRIKEIRKSRKLTQERLSELVGVDFRYISRIELGKCYPSLETLEKIANALSVELRELFEFSHMTASPIVTKQEIDELLEEADEKERQTILRVVKAVVRSIKVGV